MDHVWTWGGTYFGYFSNEDLFTHDGRHIGKRSPSGEIYDARGKYLGELQNENRLITNLAKKSWRGYGFAPHARRGSIVPFVNYVGYVMYVGHEDFPGPKAV